MDETEKKVAQLKETFPDVAESFLLEILLSCDGSVKQAEGLLGESFPNHKKRKNNATQYQSSIKRLFNHSEAAKPVLLNKANTKTIVLYDKEDIETTLAPYVTFEKNFLPDDLADRLLEYLLSNRDKCTPNKFVLFGNKCVSNHSSGLYSSNDDFVKGKTELTYNASKTNVLLYNDDLKISQLLCEDYVSKAFAERKRFPFQRSEWTADVTLCNVYDDGKNDLDWHSDRLSHIGPHNTVLSLSLGATREFRLRRVYKSKGSLHPIYSINLPHNTLLVMHPGCQEEFKHSVHATNRPLQLHHIAKTTRVNLTYRYYPEEFIKQMPKCKCDLTMLLRRSFKDVKHRGKYFWSCEGVYRDHDCKMFHWANFNKENLIADKEEDCSIWISEDDQDKWEYLRGNGESHFEGKMEQDSNSSEKEDLDDIYEKRETDKI